MSFEYIEQTYGIIVKKGDRVKYEGKEGIIVSASGAYLEIRWDGERRLQLYHPMSIEYPKGGDK